MAPGMQARRWFRRLVDVLPILLFTTSLLAACSGASGVSLTGPLATDASAADAKVPDAGSGPESAPGSGLDSAVDATVDSTAVPDSAGSDSGAADSGTDAAAACDAGGDCAGQCGQLVDPCGQVVDCGGCEAGTCGGGGTPNVCGSGPCAASCSGKACGQSDGCGGICTDGSCPGGERCVGGSCQCDSTSCAGGCCSGGVCNPGTTASACGTGGLSCATCLAGWDCAAGACVCVPDCTGKACGAGDGCGGTCASGTCGSGLHCQSASCVCDPSSCAGCCSAGQCLSGTDSGGCGTGGATCSVCSATQSCDYGTCINAVLLSPSPGGFGSGGHALVLDPAAQNLYFLDQNNSTSNMRIWRVPTAGGSGQIVASGLDWVVSLAVDSTNLYWTSIADDTVVEQSLSGGSPRVLATGQYFPMDIAVLDSTTVYWSACSDTAGTQCDVWSLPVTGGTPANVSSLSGGGNPSLALVSPNLYLASAGLREVLSLAVAPGGTTAPVDSTGLLFDGVAATAGYASWYAGESAIGASDGVVKAMQTGASPVVVAASQNPRAIAVDASYAYWANGDDSNPTLGTIVKAPTHGGSSTVLVSQALTYDITIDATNVYWLGSAGAASGVFKTPK